MPKLVSVLIGLVALASSITKGAITKTDTAKLTKQIICADGSVVRGFSCNYSVPTPNLRCDTPDCKTELWKKGGMPVDQFLKDLAQPTFRREVTDTSTEELRQDIELEQRQPNPDLIQIHRLQALLKRMVDAQETLKKLQSPTPVVQETANGTTFSKISSILQFSAQEDEPPYYPPFKAYKKPSRDECESEFTRCLTSYCGEGASRSDCRTGGYTILNRGYNCFVKRDSCLR